MSIDVELAKKLIEELESAAFYNDKGVFWYKPTELQLQEMHREFQARQLELAMALGMSIIGAELFGAISSGAAARDDMGSYVALAQSVLGVRLPDPQILRRDPSSGDGV